MTFNELLANRLNLASFPDGTESVVLPLVPELDVLVDYMYLFRKYYPDTKTHLYKPLKVYLVKFSTDFFDNSVLTKVVENCIKDVWAVYNTADKGNKMHLQRYGWKQSSDFAIIEFEELDIVYQKEPTGESLTNDATVVSYILYSKESINKWFGTVDFYLRGDIIPFDVEFDKKPTEANFIKEATNKFIEEYNVVIADK